MIEAPQLHLVVLDMHISGVVDVLSGKQPQFVMRKGERVLSDHVSLKSRRLPSHRSTADCAAYSRSCPPFMLGFDALVLSVFYCGILVGLLAMDSSTDSKPHSQADKMTKDNEDGLCCRHSLI